MYSPVDLPTGPLLAVGPSPEQVLSRLTFAISGRSPVRTVFTYYALRAYRRMGFKRPIPVTFEEVAGQPIFDNPRIINPNDGKPWVKSNSAFKHIRSDKLKYVWQLTNFDANDYLLDPEVRAGHMRFLNHTELNRKCTYSGVNPGLRSVQWAALRDSLPADWQTALRRGNQTHTEGEFFATVIDGQGDDLNAGLNNGDMGDVYKYEGGDELLLRSIQAH